MEADFVPLRGSIVIKANPMLAMIAPAHQFHTVFSDVAYETDRLSTKPAKK